MNFDSNNKDLYLPTLKSNMAEHPVFYNNTKFIANTKAFYKDLDKKLDNNEIILKNILQNSQSKIEKYYADCQSKVEQMNIQENQKNEKTEVINY